VIKISNDFGNIGTYVVYQWIHVSHSFMKHYLNIEVYHTFRNFGIHMHFKLATTLCLAYYCKIRSYISNVCSKCIYLYSLHKCIKRSHANKIKETITDLQNNTTKWKKRDFRKNWKKETPNFEFIWKRKTKCNF
jgi:hypothetical protein